MYHTTCNSTLLSDSSLSDFLLPDSPLPDVYQPALKHSSLDGFLDCPNSPHRCPAANEQHSIRVLTSSENLESMEEKGKEKQRKAREKEERAKQRQAKKALKEQQKQQQQRPKRVCPQKKASSRITFQRRSWLSLLEDTKWLWYCNRWAVQRMAANISSHKRQDFSSL